MCSLLAFLVPHNKIMKKKRKKRKRKKKKEKERKEKKRTGMRITLRGRSFGPIPE